MQTETTSGNYKIHTFTSSGCFTVTTTGSCSSNDEVSYMVVWRYGGGGGSTGSNWGGGSGAGGFREAKSSVDDYTASSGGTTGITVTATTYPITVGGGGVEKDLVIQIHRARWYRKQFSIFNYPQQVVAEEEVEVIQVAYQTVHGANGGSGGGGAGININCGSYT